MRRSLPALTPQWLQASVRHKLLAMALLPLLGVFPLLVLAIAVWSSVTYDRLLITKVRSDLAVARGYFDQVLTEVGTGTRSVALSQRLLQALDGENLAARLAADRQELGLDFLLLLPHESAGSLLPAGVTTLVRSLSSAPGRSAQIVRLSRDELAALAPHLLARLNIALVPTRNASADTRSAEDRALVLLALQPVTDAAGRPRGLLAGGVLLNQNLDFIDHINRIVYPDGALPFGSEGTATLFLDDVRITTNVRLFQNQRAIGTRVSQTVRAQVLEQGQTWLDRAFVVNDWYVSAYEPLLDARGQRVGMLYVGFLESPFRWVRHAMLVLMGLIFLGVMAVSALLSVRWARSIFRPVERMSDTLQRVQAGEADARVGTLPARDELGSLARHLDGLLDAVDDKTRSLQRWADELDRKVAERTRELADSNARLRLAQQQLVKSEKLAAIGQLTASVAHEINNPIAVMQGNLDLMRESLGPHAAAAQAEFRLLDEQIERMRLIVTQLLQHARPNEYAGYVESLDVNRVLADCLVLVNHLLARTRITLVRDWAARNPAAMNRQELQQVVINLLVNAIQAMPDGGTLTLQTLDANGAAGEPAVRIRVLDTGAGLAPAVRERLFHPFTTTRGDGTGLGLWISQGLVERYGGRIEADNRDDGVRGACFAVLLLSEAEPPVEPPPN